MTKTAFEGLETCESSTDAQVDGIARGPLGQLTLDEKIEMMSGGHGFSEGKHVTIW